MKKTFIGKVVLFALLAGFLLPLGASAQALVDCWIEAPITVSNDPLVNYESIVVKYRNKGDATPACLMIILDPLPTGVTLLSGDTSKGPYTPAPSTSVSEVTDTFSVAGTVADGTILNWQVTCKSYTDGACTTAEATESTDAVETLAIAQPSWTVIGDHWGPASYSPDGSKVVYNDDELGGVALVSSEIIVYDIATATQDVLTSNDLCDSHASFSPNGKQIVFQRESQGDNVGTIWVMNADGTDQHEVLAWGQGGEGLGSGCYTWPEWTADGRIIAKLDVDESIYVANADGTNPHRVAEAGWHQNDYDTRRTEGYTQALLRGEDNYDWVKQLQLYNLYPTKSGAAMATLYAYGESQMGRFRPWHNQVMFKDDAANNGNLFRINTNGQGLTPLTAQTRVLEYQLSDDEDTVTLDYENIISVEGVWLANDPDAGTRKGVNYLPKGARHYTDDATIDLPVALGAAGAQVPVLVSYTYLPEDCSAKGNWDRSGDVISFKSEIDGYDSIFLMRADGSNKIRLTFDNTINDGYSKKMPKISPDGETVLFSNDDGYELTLINLPAGTNARTWVGLSRGWSPPSDDGDGGGCGMMNFSTSVISLLLMLTPLAGIGLSRMIRRGRR